MIKFCKGCGQEKEHHGKGYCFNCYRKLAWKREKKICKRCKRELPLHAKGLCPGCYNFVFHTERTKAHNKMRWYGIEPESYSKITKECAVCGFNKVVELHHLDHNHKNRSDTNLAGLCPNHHKMIHNFRFRKEMRELLKKKGFNLPEDVKLDFSLD